MKVIPNEEEVAVDAIPLATKPPSIVDWKILIEGKISYFQIIRIDKSSKRYSSFIQMLRSFDREFLETLWKLVKAKNGGGLLGLKYFFMLLEVTATHIKVTAAKVYVTAAKHKLVLLDKGKGKMVEPEKPMKKKEIIRLDEEIASKLQAEFDEEVRLAREKAKKEQEANVVLTEEWDNVQARIDADYKMAQQMQVEEQEKLGIKEKSIFFVQLLKARKKHFAAMRAQEKRNKPPTKAQKRKTMSTYLKNMAGYKHNQLKNKSFDDIQKLFDKAMKMVNTFVDMDTELVEASEEIAEGSKIRAEESSKTTGEDLQ
ncbi:hypothetical protein Tco_1194663 [Tanacetum coccineum]